MGNNIFAGPFNITAAAINAAFNGSGVVFNGAPAVNISTSGYYAWSGQTVLKSPSAGELSLRNFAETIQASLVTEANDILAQRRGVNSQTFRLYNTFTDASNYERVRIGYASNVLKISGENAGTGIARPLLIQSDGITTIGIEDSTNNPGGASVGIYRNGTSGNTIFSVGSTSLTSTALLFTRLMPTVNQASGAYAVLDLNPTETAIGAGPHYLIKGRVGAGGNLWGVRNTGHIELGKLTDPAAPAANFGLLYMKDNGGGKMQIVARFPTGAVQVIATEP